MWFGLLARKNVLNRFESFHTNQDTFTLIYNFTVVDLFDNFYLLSNCYIRDDSLLSLENYIIMLPFMHIIQTQVNIAQQIPKYFEIK